MPTLAKSRNKTETGAAPKTPVVLNTKLIELCKAWGEAEGTASKYFARVAWLVYKLKLPKEQIKEALIQHRGIKKETANVEASVLDRLKDHPTEISQAVKGEITIRALRKIGAKAQVNPASADINTQVKKIKRGILAMAKLAVETFKKKADRQEFMGWAAEAFRQAVSESAGATAKKGEKNRLTEALEEGEGEESETFDETEDLDLEGSLEDEEVEGEKEDLEEVE